MAFARQCDSALARLDGLALEFSAQGRRQRGAGYEGLLQRGDVRACRVRFVEHNLEQVRRTAIDAGPKMGDRRDELFGVAGTGWDDWAAERERAALEDPSAGRQVIGKAVDNDVAGGDARRGKHLGRAPRIAADGLRFVDSPGEAKRRGNALVGAAASAPNGGSALCSAAIADLRKTGMSA